MNTSHSLTHFFYEHIFFYQSAFRSKSIAYLLNKTHILFTEEIRMSQVIDILIETCLYHVNSFLRDNVCLIIRPDTPKGCPGVKAQKLVNS